MKLLALLAFAPLFAHAVTFEEIPARGPAKTEVTVTIRVASAEEVRTECYWIVRKSWGLKPDTSQTADTPACGWLGEDGRMMVLTTDPKSFNNHRALEALGHEVYHKFEIIDHK